MHVLHAVVTLRQEPQTHAGGRRRGRCCRVSWVRMQGDCLIEVSLQVSVTIDKRSAEKVSVSASERKVARGLSVNEWVAKGLRLGFYGFRGFRNPKTRMRKGLLHGAFEKASSFKTRAERHCV
jgi:hypothetical protein